jgi:hypothetical protein
MEIKHNNAGFLSLIQLLKQENEYYILNKRVPDELFS